MQSGIVCAGNIDTAKINSAHKQIREIVESYKSINLEISQITKVIKENWIGTGRNEFESQYNLLIKKVDDFGDALQEIYDALVQSEAEYEKADDQLRQAYAKAVAGDTTSANNKTSKSGSSADADWIGYESSSDNPGVAAYVGKAGAEAENEIGYAGVNAYLGKVDASAKSDFSFMERKTKSEYKDGEWTEKTTTEFLNAELSAGVDVSIFSTDGEAGVGNDMLGAEVEGEGSLGNAELSGKGEFSVGRKEGEKGIGIELNAKGKAMVSAAEGEVKGTINILGIEITGTLGGYAGAVGVEGEIGVDDGKFKLKGGAAALFGGSVGVEIGFNETGWDNFVDAVTFWD